MMTSNCMTVAELELAPVACVAPVTSLAQAARVLADTRDGVLLLDTVPLCELTDADIVEAIAAGRSPGTHLDALGAGAPQFVRPDTSAEDAAAMMIVTGRRALVVVDEGRPLGLVRLRVVAGALWGGKSWLSAFRIALHIENI